jgi:predicted nucleic acid-binding protein
VSGLTPLGFQHASKAATASPAGPAPPSGSQILIPDACVGVKWYVPESDSQAAARLLDPRFALHVPDYFFTEAASILQRKVALEGTLSESDALDVYRRLRTIPMTIHATAGLLEDAIRHGVRYRRPVYDSLYLTLAAARGGRVVTADGRLYRGVHGGPLDHLVLWVTDPL